MNIDPYELIIFDADGTLIDRDSGTILPGVLDFFQNKRQEKAYAIVTNQGGPACHDAGWESSHIYPNLEFVERRYSWLAERLATSLYICWAYFDRSGRLMLPNKYAVMPEDARPKSCLRDWRKPSPGMLIQVMWDAHMEPCETLMVGDRDEDEEAAYRAGCAFAWASVFFGRA